MLKFGNKGVAAAYNGRRAIAAIYQGARQIWQAIRSCFAGGFWNNRFSWSNKDGWKNGK